MLTPVVIGGFDLSAFLNQPVDKIVTDLILYLGWIPFLFVFLHGIFETWLEMQRHYWRHHRPYILLAIDVPRLTEQSPKAVENIFGVTVALKSGPTWLETYLMGKVQWRHSFEITSINGYIQFYIWTEARYRDVLEAAVYAQYPDAEIALVDDYVKAVPHHYPNEQWDLWGSEYILSKPNFFPIRTWADYEHSITQELKDPLVMLFEGMAQMRPGEQLWTQVITAFSGDDWKAEGDAFIKKTFGVSDKHADGGGILGALGSAVLSVPNVVLGDMFGHDEHAETVDKFKEEAWKAFKVTEQEREITKAVVRKIAKPGLACKIRVIYVARKEVFSKVSRKDMMKGFLKQLAHQDLNSFGGFGAPEDDYFWQIWWYSYYQNKLIKGFVERSVEIGATPFVLNTEELATLWHFPTVNVKVPLIKKTLAKRSEPPTEIPFATEAEELLTAPSMVRPPGEGEEEAGPPPDVFAMPMSMPPRSPSLPSHPTLHKKAPLPEHIAQAEGGEDLPKPTAPTFTSRPTSSPSVSPDVPASISPPIEKAPIPAPVSPTRSRAIEIPDAIRVLVEPGVEPEDVGIHDTLDV